MEITKCNTCGALLKDKKDELCHLYRKHPEYLMSISILEAALSANPAIILKTKLADRYNMYKVMYVCRKISTGDYVTLGTICSGTEKECDNILYELFKFYNQIMPNIMDTLVSHNLINPIRPRIIKISDISMKYNDSIITAYDMDRYEQYNDINLFCNSRIAI